MLKTTLMMGLLTCAVALAEDKQVIVEKDKDHFETPFSSGGRLNLELCSADVKVSASEGDKISIHYESRESEEIQGVRISFSKTDGAGTLKLSGGPHNDFHIRIEVPLATELHVRMPFGALEIAKIHGSKNVSLHAGQVTIAIGDPNDYAHIEASVLTGALDSPALGISKGGLFRSFRREGPGKHELYAHVGSGEIDLR